MRNKVVPMKGIKKLLQKKKKHSGEQKAIKVAIEQSKTILKIDLFDFKSNIAREVNFFRVKKKPHGKMTVKFQIMKIRIQRKNKKSKANRRG